MDIVELMAKGLSLPERLDSYCEDVQVIIAGIDEAMANNSPETEKKLILIRMAVGQMANNLSHEAMNEYQKMKAQEN